MQIIKQIFETLESSHDRKFEKLLYLIFVVYLYKIIWAKQVFQN